MRWFVESRPAAEKTLSALTDPLGDAEYNASNFSQAGKRRGGPFCKM